MWSASDRRRGFTEAFIPIPQLVPRIRNGGHIGIDMFIVLLIIPQRKGKGISACAEAVHAITSRITGKGRFTPFSQL